MTIYEKAILDTIAYAEGTLGVSRDGYDVIVTFPTIIGWTDDTDIRHRCVRPTGNLTAQKIKDKGGTVCTDKPVPAGESGESWYRCVNKSCSVASTAAGRYQFLGSSWATTTEKLGLGFNAPMTKDNQNKAAIRAVKTKRKVTETELKNAYSSFSSFEVVRNKLKDEWTSFKLNESSRKKTPKDYWEVYKFAVKKYKAGPQNGTTSTSKGKKYIVDGNGNIQSSVGTSNTNRYIINVPPNKKTKKIIFFWAGLETSVSRDTQWNQIPDNVKSKYYIIMSAGIGGTSQLSTFPLSKLEGVMDNFFKKNSIATSCCGGFSKSILGYSAGGKSVIKNYNSSFDVVGLIDPSLPNSSQGGASVTENRKWGRNTTFIWGSSGMQGLGSPTWGTRYPQLESKIKADGGFAKKIAGLNHGKAIEKWFSEYGNQFT